MLGKTIFRKTVTLAALAAVWSVYSMVAFAVPVDSAAEITVNGQVTVNGQPAASNGTVLSGAVIATGDGSSATISLGKNGRIEIEANTSVTLTFGPTNIVAVVESNGDIAKVRISSAAGIATTATTKNATFVADAGQADSFALEVECSHTHVDTTGGLVTMREGTSDRQVAAGTSAVAGRLDQPGCKPCLRPDSTPGPKFFGGAWWLALAAAAAGIGIILSTHHRDLNIGGTAIVVNPTPTPTPNTQIAG